jgi:hypothetical protein
MDGALAVGVLVVHLAWIAWVLLGWTLTRWRRVLGWAHVASLGYSIFIEVSQLPCPLTLAEVYFERRASITPYRQPFVVHYLEAAIYPDISPAALTAGAVAVCAAILAVHFWRWRRSTERWETSELPPSTIAG